MKASKILKDALEKIKPSEKEKQATQNKARDLIEKIKNIPGLHKDVRFVGSSARGTGLKDIDLFVLYPETLPEKILEEDGLRIGLEVAKGHDTQVKYASHPYVKANIDGFEVEIVPAFQVSSAENIKSAVDRTPFHHEYVIKKLKRGQEDQVLLLKAFLKNLDLYGADIGTKGFSGYLSELLIIKYASFENLLKHSSTWDFGEFIDLEGHGAPNHYNDALIVIDPVDSKRNVASAVSKEAMAKFIHYARLFTKKPSKAFFKEKTIKPLTRKQARDEMQKRKSTVLLVKFPAPKVVEDIALSQAERGKKKIKEFLERNEFKLHRTDLFWDDAWYYYLFEFEVWQLPRYKLHEGPPLTEISHQEKFLEKAVKEKRSVWIEDGKWYGEKEREFLLAHDALLHYLDDVKKERIHFVSHVTKSMQEKLSVYDAKGVLDEYEKNENLQNGLTQYLKKKERFLTSLDLD